MYASRIEETICKAIQFGFIDEIAKDAMLRNKFWTGLASQSLKNSTRHLYDSIKDFQYLLREIRKVQQEEAHTSTRQPKSKSAAVHAERAEVTESQEDMKKELRVLISKMERFYRVLPALYQRLCQSRSTAE
ncbi:uncharacterized protein LOC134266386 [Saccostrea cucullata]|uniref:uncharacterized protein LOC134266386 n=1 Tax=Saccostrea cuccullata TaxID=36930 RepID=UPI002ED142F8